MGTFDTSLINEALKGTQFVSNNERYAFAKLKREDYSKVIKVLETYSSDEFVEIILDKDELTIIVRKVLFEKDIKENFEIANKVLDIALIMCDVSKGIGTVTGYLLAIANALSPANIGIYVQGAYTTDHIGVDYDNLDKAIETLSNLKNKVNQILQ